MYQMVTRVKIPINTIADGTSLITIIPNLAPYSYTHFPAAVNKLPFCSQAIGNTTSPFSVAPTTYDGFSQQYANIQTFAVDFVNMHA